MHKIGIVIPAYNESSVISDVLSSLPKKIKNYSVKVIVVNDGSSDTTAALAKQFKNVIVIDHILNSGAGAATRTGLNYARKTGCEIVATMDADGQHSSEDVTKLVRHALENKSDLVIGSRLISSEGMPWHRVLGNKGLSFITYIIFGVFVSDSQSGLKVLKKEALDKITFHSNNYAFCSEIIWQAHKNKLAIEEVPIRAIYSDYSLSKGQSNWNSINIIRQLIKRRLLEFIDG